MIKVSVIDPNKPGARFNHDYYRDTHVPLVKQSRGDKCKYYGDVNCALAPMPSNQRAPCASSRRA